MLISISFLAFPGLIYCRAYDNCENFAAYSLVFNSIEKNIISEVKPSATEAGDKFYPILITSCIVLGVLIFAMWQTFKSKRNI